MQQTTQYQLNLIETDDAFSPNPLNDNTQKLEAALQAAEAAQAAETQARRESDSALAQRIAHIESFKMVSGAYQGNNKERVFDLGFRPQLVLISSEATSGVLTRSAGEVIGNTHVVVGAIVSNGFKVFAHERAKFNNENNYYHYFAMG